jgi:hypothetical protein
MIAEMIRRYTILGLECTILETQKLTWVLDRVLAQLGITNPFDLEFQADRYGPYAPRLRHLLDALDGSYLHCCKRINDASRLDTIDFDSQWQTRLTNYLRSAEGAPFMPVIETADRVIDGFQSPLGMEALATVDWLLSREGVRADVQSVRAGIERWPAGSAAAARKQRLFSDRLLQASLDRWSWFESATR